MRCRKAHEYISRSIDGELAVRKSARLERHLAACEDCRVLREDLRRIVAGAAKLVTPEPSDKVWLNIRAGLVRATAGRAGERSGGLRQPAFGLGLASPALRYAGVAAVALVLVVTGVVVGRRLGRGPAPLGPEAREKYTLAKLDEAEHYYQQAIKSLGEAFTAEKGTLSPQVAEFFDRNLSVVDATIQACRRAVLDEPEDLEARNYLLAAYTKKITLLDSALDLQRGNGEAAGKTKRT
jgi:tetratricopeptide (TPR) repeat protein